MLAHNGDDLAHVSVNGKKLLTFIAKVMPNHHCLPIWVSDIARDFCEQTPIGRNDCARAGGEDGCPFISIDVNAGMYNIWRKKYSSISVFRQRPVDIVRGDRAGKIKMIIRGN